MRARPGLGGVVAMGIVGLFGFLLMYVWERLEARRLGYHVEALRLETADLENRTRYLKIQLTALGSMERMGHLAVKYGMTPPRRDKVMVITGTPR